MSMFASSDGSEDERRDCEDGGDIVATVGGGHDNSNTSHVTEKHNKKTEKKKKKNVDEDGTANEPEHTTGLKLSNKRSYDDVDRIFETFKDHGDDETFHVASTSGKSYEENGVRIRKPIRMVHVENKKDSKLPEEDGYHLHKLERKRFMASNAEKILDVEATERLLREKMKHARKLERAAEKQEKEDFRKISREIQSFGMCS
jgi:hypothetical protein